MLQLHQLLRRLIGALLWCVEVGPVLPQLVPAVLGRKDPARGVEGDAFPIAEPGGEALGGGEALPGPVGVVAPDAGPRLQLSAQLDAWGAGHAVLDLAGVGGRPEVDV